VKRKKMGRSGTLDSGPSKQFSPFSFLGKKPFGAASTLIHSSIHWIFVKWGDIFLSYKNGGLTKLIFSDFQP